MRTDEAWRQAAESYAAATAAADQAIAALNEAKARVTALASHPKEEGAGVAVTQFWKQGAVDYKRVPELKGVDLSEFHSASRLETRITLLNESKGNQQ